MSRGLAAQRTAGSTQLDQAMRSATMLRLLG